MSSSPRFWSLVFEKFGSLKKQAKWQAFRKSFKPRLEVLEDRLCPTGSGPTAVETYEWAMINNMRTDPTGFAYAIQTLLNGTESQLGYSTNDPVVKDLNAAIQNASYPAHFQQALSLLRSVGPAGPLAWDNTLQAGAAEHDVWMQTHSFQHSGQVGIVRDQNGQVIYLPGYTTGYSGGSPDAYEYPPSVSGSGYSTWGENIGFEDNALRNTVAAFGTGTNAYLQRVAFYDAMSYILELNSDDLGHLENLLGRDSTSAGLGLLGQVSKGAGIPDYNVIGLDLFTYQGPDGPASMSTQRLGFDTGIYGGALGGGYVSGVAFEDANNNYYYNIGAGVNVTMAFDDTLPSGLVVSEGEILGAGTNNYGAFNTYLPNGLVTVTAYAGSRKLGVQNVYVNNDNQWVEFLVSPGFGLTDSTTATMAPDRYEPNNTPAAAYNLGTATPASPFQSQTDMLSISSVTDQDWFQFTISGQAVAGNQVFLGYDPSSGVVRQSLFTPRADGSMGLFRTDTLSSSGSTLDLSGLAAGTYFIGISGDVNFYSFTIDLTPAATDPTPVLVGPDSTSTSLTPELTWEPVVNAVSYHVYLNDLTTGASNILNNETVTTSTFEPLALVPGQNYRYWVQSVFANGTSPWSLPNDFSTGVAVPMDATTFTDLQPSLTFTAVPGASQYQIWVEDLTTGQNNLFPGAGVTAGTDWQQSWSVPAPLTSGDKYAWWVKALNSTGQGSWSDTGTFSVAAPVTSGPTGTVASLVPALSWSAITGAVSYDVYLTDATTGQSNLFSGTNVASNSWTVSAGLVSGHSYQWWVRADSSAGVGEWSSAGQFSIMAMGVPTLDGPSGAQGTDQPSFYWSPGNGLTPLSNDLWIQDQTTLAVTSLTGLSGTSYTLAANNALTPGHSFVWYVAAASTNNQALAWSKSGSFSITALGAPTLNGPSGAQGTDQPSFYWNAGNGLTPASYDLWIQDQTTLAVTSLTGLSGTSYTLTANNVLTPGHSFVWYVAAVSTNKQALAWSKSGSFSITALGAPTLNGPSGAQGTDEPYFYWNAGNGLTPASYDLWIQDQTTLAVTSLTGLSGTSYTLTANNALTPGHSFVWYVAAVSTNKQALAWSKSGSFSITALGAPTLNGPSGAQGTDEPYFYWNVGSGLTPASYDLWIQDQTTLAVTSLTGLSGTSYTLTANNALTPGHIFVWYVAAVSTNEQAVVWSKALTFST